MIGLGSPITAAIAYGVAALVAALLLVIAGEAVAIHYLDGKLDTERERYGELQEKNGRCEAETARLKGSVDTQNKAVDDLKGVCAAATTTAEAAMKIATGQRPVTAKQIADILAGKPQDADLCKAACIEIRREVRK